MTWTGYKPDKMCIRVTTSSAFSLLVGLVENVWNIVTKIILMIQYRILSLQYRDAIISFFPLNVSSKEYLIGQVFKV